MCNMVNTLVNIKIQSFQLVNNSGEYAAVDSLFVAKLNALNMITTDV